LGSNFFIYAAQFTVRDLMKYTIYRELNKLTELYSFAPEQIGFASVDRKSTIPSNMSSFTWDEVKDEMFDTEGKPIEKKPKIHSHTPTGIVHHWDPTRWAKDIYTSEDEETEVTIPSTSNMDTLENIEINFP
jgi:hypothetical protein